MSFEDALARAARETDALLDQLLPERGAAAPRLVAAMRYAALGPGKRLRPFLVVESAALFDVPRAEALRVGAALECVHCYSLVHDDLPAMDDDDLRRGRPTTHKAYDEATAILAGDALLTFAFDILGDAATHGDPAVRIALVQALAKASGMAGMAGGQMLDIAAESRVSTSLSEITLIQNLKTGALFSFACEAGAILAGADPKPLRQYADHIGLAFQIADDILDVESDALTLGKATQKDVTRGKATFVDLLGLDEAKRRARDLVQQAEAALGIYGAQAGVLKEAAQFIIARKA
ncbi:polyprenyl synthetase family protein [Aestuariivirga sp.]|uniref:polyprenyl synthetase family protein n=1 Tax=Aestuariivirga sp. TaxID=2650926 RepID=UPI0039E5745C